MYVGVAVAPKVAGKKALEDGSGGRGESKGRSCTS
jgi:hypothetical protein